MRRCIALLVLAACAAPAATPRQVLDVTGIDYAYAAPDTVAAGEAEIAFHNAGTVMHEVKLIALRPGVDLATVLPLARVDTGWAAYREPTSGILTARPGETTPGRLLVTFATGRHYLLICHFADTDDAPLHSELGMAKVLVVR